jgi:hypothetical protein
MKYLGQKPRNCDCRCCVGNGDSKAVNKARKHSARQKAKKEYVLVAKPSKPSFSKAMINKLMKK